MKDLSELERLNLAARAEVGAQVWSASVQLLFIVCLSVDLFERVSSRKHSYLDWALVVGFALLAVEALFRIVQWWRARGTTNGTPERFLVAKWATNLSGSVVIMPNVVQLECGSFWTGYHNVRLAREGNWLFIITFQRMKLKRLIALQVLDASTTEVNFHERTLEVGALRFKNVKNASESLHQLGSALQLSTAGA